jgi:hypothetical protein
MKLLELRDRLGDIGIELLGKFFDLDPNTRISAE